MNARDWQAVLEINEDYLAECRAIGSSDTYFQRVALKANALSKLGRPQEALAVSDDCIKQSYGTTDCHVERYWALVATGRVEDAAVEKDRTLRLISAELEQLGQSDLDKSRRSLLAAWMNNLGNS